MEWARGQRPTIGDVARAAGVSYQTVSNVLHGRGRMADATRQRVRAVIEALDYVPHAGTAAPRTRRIAHSLPPADLAGDHLVTLGLVRELTRAAAARGQRLLLATDAADLHEVVAAGAADAVVLAGVADRDPRVSMLAARGVPFAAFGRTAPDEPQSWVDIDNRAAARQITSRLLGEGRKTVFLGYEAQGRWDVERESGFRDAVRDAGRPARIHTTCPDPGKVCETIDAMLDLGPTAVVTASDTLAAAVYQAAERRGLRIGDDLAVIGFDDSPVGRVLSPELTTVAIPLAEVAWLLVERVLAELDGPTGGPGQVLMPRLVEGLSAGRPVR